MHNRVAVLTLTFGLFIAMIMPLLLPVSAAAETVVKIGGTGTALGSMRLLGDAYEKKHPGVKVQVIPSLGSIGGIKSVLEGVLDLGVSSRLLKEDELKAGAVPTEYARTPFFFVANHKVDKSGLTIGELESIYLGKTHLWPDNTRIRLVLRPETDQDTRLVKSISPGMARAVDVALAREGMILAATDVESDETVAKTPGALGASTLTQLMTGKLPMKMLSFNGVKPSLKAIADGTYPLQKTLWLVTVPNTSAAARQFVEFVRSPAGRKILANSGNLAVTNRVGN